MSALPENPTGADLLDALRRHAVSRGVTTKWLARQLSKQPSSWLIQLPQAKNPTQITIARVRALIAGEPIPDLPSRRLPPRAPAASDPVFAGPSGAELAAAIRRAAADRGLTLREFAGDAVRDPWNWLIHLESARRPAPTTIAKAEALLAQPIPPVAAPVTRLAEEVAREAEELARRRATARAQSLTPLAATTTEPPPQRARDRNPCFRCGVSGDRGCIHYPLEMRA